MPPFYTLAKSLFLELCQALVEISPIDMSFITELINGRLTSVLEEKTKIEKLFSKNMGALECWTL